MDDTSLFKGRLHEQLDAAAAKRNERQEHLEQEMSALMQRELDFGFAASSVMTEVIRPRMVQLADCFENASMGSTTSASPRCCRVHFDHCDRFPATVDVTATVLSDDAVQSMLIMIDVRILPVFIKFAQHSQLSLPLSQVPKDLQEKATTWLEDRLIRFVSEYLSIEHAEQYHQHNYAIDPVCGMKVLKKDALHEQHFGHTFYFCAAICRDRFTNDPDAFLRESDASS